MTCKVNAAMRCAILCVLLNPSQSTWHILCLTHRNKFQFVYVSKWHDRGQISSPISSRNLMPEFESMHLILIYNLKPCSKVLSYLLHCIFFTLDIVIHLGYNKKSEATEEDYIYIVMSVDICKPQSHSVSCSNVQWNPAWLFSLGTDSVIYQSYKHYP